MIPKNPFVKIKTPSTGQRSRVLSPAEMLALYRACGAEFRRYLWCQLHTCARPIELRELVWASVDLDGRVIRLEKFKAKDKRRDGLRVRMIPLDVDVTTWLAREHRRRSPHPDDFVFVNSRGRAWTPNGLRCAMRRARVKAGLCADGKERPVCYTLRHTGATEAVRAGIRDTELADIMGHTQIGMTRRYLHRTAADLVGIIDRRRAG